MRIKTTKENMLDGINIIQNIINPRTNLPILSNILIDAQKDSIKLIATDLDIGISYEMKVEVLEEGGITFPAKRFGDIIKELPDGALEIVTKKNNAINITSENCMFKIMGLPKEEFPKLPEFKDKEVIKIEQAVLKEMVDLTAFAVSHDETRYILNGALLKIKNEKLTLVATDGRRLAVVERNLTIAPNKEIAIIVPIKTFQELHRNLQEEGELSLVLGSNQALFDLGSIIIISRLIEGEFPDYQQVIPPPAETKITLDRQVFISAVRRAALLVTPDYQAIRLEVFAAKGGKSKLVISKSTPDIGESREELEVDYSGKEQVVGFNPQYLVDVLRNLKDENINFEITAQDKPGVIRTEGYIYIVLPMRLA